MPQGSQNTAQLPRYISVELPGPGRTGGAGGHPGRMGWGLELVWMLHEMQETVPGGGVKLRKNSRVHRKLSVHCMGG